MQSVLIEDRNDVRQGPGNGRSISLQSELSEERRHDLLRTTRDEGKAGTTCCKTHWYTTMNSPVPIVPLILNKIICRVAISKQASCRSRLRASRFSHVAPPISC
jgi:hypothetical protein